MRFLIPTAILALLFFGGVANGQSLLELPLDGSEQDKKLAQFLEEFERKHEVKFYFLDEWIAPFTIDDSYAGQTLGDLLENVLRESDLSFVVVHDRALAFVKDPTVEITRREAIVAAGRRQQSIETATVGNPDLFRPGRLVTLRGRIIHEEDRTPITGATVVPNGVRGTTTDREGRYELRLPSGRHVLSINFIGFKERTIDLTLYEGGDLNLSLQESPVLLEEIVISSQPINELTVSRPGQLQLSVGAMKKQPSLLGEADLVRQLQSLPGVNTVGEAAAGFNVRGGSVDQNLVLYDGLPLFNTSHALGFFSAFYSEAIQEMSFYRGGIPAEFGGRVSSVLDIRSKAGDPERWRVNGGIGLISANLMARGPLVKNRTTLAASVRGTYANWYLDLLKNTYKDLTNSQVGFYDGDLRLEHALSNKSKLSFSYYRSFDRLRVRGDTTFQWVNQLISVRLDQMFSPRFTGSFLLGVGDYNYTVSNVQPAQGFDLDYQVTYPTLKMDFLLTAGAHRLSFGIQSTYYAFNPGRLRPTTAQSSIRSVTMESQQSLESGIYLADSYNLTDRLVLDAGVRLSSFVQFGPATVNVYSPPSPIEEDNLTDSIKYASGETVTSFMGVEPRAAIRFSLDNQSSLKLSYHRIYQYLHLVSNTAAVTPIDIWQPSNTFFKPQVSDQISVGYFRDFKQKMYEAYAEVFYKEMDNVLDFKDGAELILNKTLEADLLQGKGLAYGIEAFLSKSQGRLTWTMSYTYSRSLRKFDPGTETINNGETFPSSYDQPHMLNLSWNYRLSRRWSFTGNFAYRTGRPVTVPVFGFTVDGYGVAYFSGRNQYRIPDYHRLDLALVIEGSHKLKKPWSGSWTISFLNVYARRNAYSYFFASDTPGKIDTYQLSILGTIVPSVTYNFKF
ncbi:MAG: TonB-dependent receptor [Cyclobacteriaceae bacterium]|nr:TonB-dependent receptor [Cyclobacteriaceae bacterium]